MAQKTARRKQRRKSKVEEYRGFRIRFIEASGRHVSNFWQVDAVRAGRRVRRSFPDRDAARHWCEVMAAEVANEGVDAFNLTTEHRRDAAAALRLLAGRGTLEDAVKQLDAAWATLGGRATVGQAVAFWAKHNPDGGAVALGDMVARFVDGRLKARCSPPHVRALRGRLASLVSVFGAGVPVAGILGDDLESFLDSRDNLSPRSRNAWLVTLRQFFRHAVKTRVLDSDPTAHLTFQKVAPIAPRFLSAGDCEKLLRAAETVAPNCAAAVAIQFFAGVRPVELAGQYRLRGQTRTTEDSIVGGLRWEDVDIEGGHIRIRPEISKVSQQRLIPIAPNLRAWLLKYGTGKTGRIIPNPTAWKRARTAIEEKAGVAWGQDYARHSYASHHFAMHASRDLLEAAMGHGRGSSELETSYKGLATPAEAETFWAISPSGVKAPKKSKKEKA